ncbi:MAG: argininosuccinate lyase, partial [Nitrospinales bacterium]
VPFREAHEITGKTVAWCLQNSKILEDLTADELRAFSPHLKEDVRDWLSVQASVDRKQVYGGTAKKRVQEQIQRLRRAWR